MELRLSPEEVLDKEAKLLTTAFDTELCSMTTVALVNTHQCIQPNHHFCTVEGTMGYGAADAFRALELGHVGTLQGKRSFASVA